MKTTYFLNLVLFIVILGFAYGLNIAGIRKSDRSSLWKIVGVLGLVLMLAGVFAELLHAASIIRFYVGEVAVGALFFIGVGLTILSAFSTIKKGSNIASSIGFAVVTFVVAFITFFMIALSAI